MEGMRILLADPQLRIRKTMRLILPRISGIEIVGEITSDADLVPGVRSTKPNLILLDVDLSGAQLEMRIAQIRCEMPRVIIVGLSGKHESGCGGRIDGLDEFISKSEPADKVLMILKKYTQRS
jgi:DNA-binding NarL/FixJ family response regulator